jgi:hypothetical protein
MYAWRATEISGDENRGSALQRKLPWSGGARERNRPVELIGRIRLCDSRGSDFALIEIWPIETGGTRKSILHPAKC